VLYHGTTHQAIKQITADGLRPMSRQYVHMSVDKETAVIVGQRRDHDPVILTIDAKAASKDGVKFYIGNEKTWLADFVPAKYIHY
jgi:putative RNA 2'-phosphotransferase